MLHVNMSSQYGRSADSALNNYTAEQYRRDAVHCVRKLAREITAHSNDSVALGFDLEEMQAHAVECDDRFVRELVVRYLTHRNFDSSQDPKRTRECAA